MNVNILPVSLYFSIYGIVYEVNLPEKKDFMCAFAILVILLGFSLVRRLRRNAYRHQVREELEAEIAEQEPRD